MRNKYILITGGLGYIGSHVSVSLLEKKYNIIIVDDLSNSSISVIEKIKLITDRDFEFFEYDIRDEEKIKKIFLKFEIIGVMHFAGLKSVSESVIKSIDYYSVNVSGSISLLKILNNFQVKAFIFSSSATVYKQQSYALDENCPLGPSNPYGYSKLFIEQVMHDLNCSMDVSCFISLRYFNPVGAHKSRLIGERPNGIPNNLVPFISKVAKGSIAKLRIFGQDYETHDGTGVRDYIHILDIVDGHIRALEFALDNSGYKVFNLGTGKGYSVLDVVEEFQICSGKKVAIEFTKRRAGDIDCSIANSELANKVLGWRAKRTLKDMCTDAWNWEKSL